MMTLKLRNLFKSFRADESGAVTVDWVVLTAAIVGLGLVVMSTVGPKLTAMSTTIATDVGNAKSNATGN